MNRIDHILLKTDDLHKAVQDFEAAGFKVFYGSPKERAHNALVYLQDHSFIELLRTTVIPSYGRALAKWGILKLISPMFHRFAYYYFNEGPIVDFAIYSTQIADFHQRVRKESSSLATNFKREKPNGTTVRWKLFTPKNEDFPFVMSDYTPEKMSSDETNIHPNGITGIQRLEIDVGGDIDQFRGALQQYYGVGEERLKRTEEGFEVRTENATLVYRRADTYKIRQLVLSPSNKMVEERLRGYGIRTAGEKNN
ncbi:MAG: VOC family protein [Bacteroidota bacterium]